MSPRTRPSDVSHAARERAAEVGRHVRDRLTGGWDTLIARIDLARMAREVVPETGDHVFRLACYHRLRTGLTCGMEFRWFGPGDPDKPMGGIADRAYRAAEVAGWQVNDADGVFQPRCPHGEHQP